MRIQELGHVVLYVTDLNRSADFYKNTLGFTEIYRGNGTALFSSGRTHHEMLLIEVGGEPVKKHRAEPGLYHIGFKIGTSPQDAKDVYRELKEKSITIVGTTDHGVTHSIYILDPDGNELELYADVSDEWKRDPMALIKTMRLLDLE
jgi:catechol-2,3-dioxygenase